MRHILNLLKFIAFVILGILYILNGFLYALFFWIRRSLRKMLVALMPKDIHEDKYGTI